MGPAAANVQRWYTGVERETAHAQSVGHCEPDCLRNVGTNLALNICFRFSVLSRWCTVVSTPWNIRPAARPGGARLVQKARHVFPDPACGPDQGLTQPGAPGPLMHPVTG
jgi:hypothetical protein